MRLRYEKTIRIVTDLLGYCRYLGAWEFDTNFKLLPGKTIIVVKAEVASMNNTQFDELHVNLHIPRQPEVEQNYWNVMGNEDTEPDLSLVGMMVDVSEVHYQNGILTISVERWEN